jgi:hypothetical protein
MMDHQRHHRHVEYAVAGPRQRRLQILAMEHRGSPDALAGQPHHLGACVHAGDAAGAADQEFLRVKPRAAAQIQDRQAGHRTEHGKHGRPIVVGVERPVARVCQVLLREVVVHARLVRRNTDHGTQSPTRLLDKPGILICRSRYAVLR